MIAEAVVAADEAHLGEVVELQEDVEELVQRVAQRLSLYVLIFVLESHNF